MRTRVEDDSLYDVPTIAKILGYKDRTVRKLLREKKFQGRKLGRKWLVPGASIKAYFDVQNPTGT